MRTIKHHKGVAITLLSPEHIKKRSVSFLRMRSKIKVGHGCKAMVGNLEFSNIHTAKQFINALAK